MNKRLFAGLFSILAGLNTPSPFQQTQIRIPQGNVKRKKGSGVHRSRVKPIRRESEEHLYGNKLARKAFRGVMTLKCAR